MSATAFLGWFMARAALRSGAGSLVWWVSGRKCDLSRAMDGRAETAVERSDASMSHAIVAADRAFDDAGGSTGTRQDRLDAGQEFG